jgi:hypothetical protein
VHRVVEGGLAVHALHPLTGVYGVELAKRLLTRRVPTDDVLRVHRFFAVNSREYALESQLQHMPETSVLARAWLLHGAEAGKAWARRVYCEEVASGTEPDSLVELFKHAPHTIYDRFSVSAWIWEYGLDTRTAARFVEEYFRATGNNLDFRRAFGSSAGAVGNALYRRIHAANPFREAARALKLVESWTPLPRLNGLPFSPLAWAPLVAYLTLACEDHDLLTSTHAAECFPGDDEDPLPYHCYDDFTWAVCAYMHPRGPYADTLAESSEICAMMRDARSARLSRDRVITLLESAREDQCPHLRDTLLSHLGAQRWGDILRLLPIDSDVTPAYREFVDSRAR